VRGIAQVCVSPPKLGGVDASSKQFQVPCSRTGWFPSQNFSECIPKRFGLGTTPSAGIGSLARLFLTPAATPPNLGGDTPDCDTSAFQKETLCS